MQRVLFTLCLITFTAGSLLGQSGSINNTLGTGGTFIIKDGSTTFFSLGQSNGNISVNNTVTLPVTTDSTIGVLYKGTDRFIHDFHPSGSFGQNTFVGIRSGNFTMTGSGAQACYNTAVGASTLAALTNGTENVAIGYHALSSNTTGYTNSAVGSYALSGNTTGSANSAFGTGALSSNTSGIDNAAFGNGALSVNSTGNYNSSFGYGSLFYNTTGNLNSAFGYSSLSENTTGVDNSAFGNSSLYSNTTGINNSAFGSVALYYNTTGKQNTAVGYKSLALNVTGFQNTAVGDSALYGNTGNYNTAIGYNAGSQVTSGANLTLIGIDANPSSATTTNEITLGNGYVSTLRCNTSTISSLSDARDKRNIRDLPLGLDFLMTVKPRLFNWDRREWYENGKPDGSKMKQEPTAGFIAQELDTAQTHAHAEWLNLVLKTNPNRMEATSGNLLPIMVKAIQELKMQNDALRTENNLVKERLSSLERKFSERPELSKSDQSLSGR